MALAGALRIGLALTVLGSAGARGQCSPHELFAANGASGDAFGASVSLDGTTAFLGAPYADSLGPDSGAVYVFERLGGSWTQTAELTAADGAAGDRFGASVVVEGTLALVGAPGDDDLGADSGSAYVFSGGAQGWSETAKLLAATGAAGDAFGHALAVSGGTALIGAPLHDGAGSDSGAAFVFEDVGGAWTELGQLTGATAGPGAFLGTSVSIAGTTAVLGGTPYDIPGGQAYVFERANGQWGPNETARLLPSGGSPTFRFGFSVANEGDVALVGAPGDNPGSFGSGAVYVFERSAPGVWSAQETAKLSVNHGQEILELGFSLSMNAGRALVGAYETHSGSGAAHVFENRPGGWAQVAAFRSPEPGFPDGFGFAVSLSGATALVGTVQGDGAVVDSGNAFAYQVPTFAESFCFCGVQAPCGNESGAGGCANSTGLGALMNACGSGSVAADDLELSVVHVPPSKSAIVFMGPAQIQVPFGDGTRCVGAGGVGVYRFPLQDSGASGVLQQGPGIVAHSQARFKPPGKIAAGQTWHFQAWYRDAQGPCAGQVNLSSAVSVTFGP